jgi:hypothetical protein
MYSLNDKETVVQLLKADDVHHLHGSIYIYIYIYAN